MRKLFFCLLLLAAMAGLAAAGQLSRSMSGLVFLAHLNEGTGMKALELVSGTQGTVTGCAWDRGMFGSGLHGVVYYNGVTFNGLTNIGDSITVSFWVRSDIDPAIPEEYGVGWPHVNDVMGQRGAAGGSFRVELTHYPGYGSIGYANWRGGTYDEHFFNVENVILKYKWEHVVVVSERNVKTALYVNGVLIGSQGEPVNAPIDPATGELIVFRSPFGSPSEYLRGILDDMAVFNRALSPGEIKSIYLSGLGRHGEDH